MIHKGEDDSPITPNLFQQQTPGSVQTHINLRNTNKRPRSNISPPDQYHHQQIDFSHQPDPTQSLMTHPSSISKRSFPPFVITFKGEQQTSIKEITDELILKGKSQHGIDLALTARFGHMHSLLIFADDSKTFETLLEPNRWPKALKEVDLEVKIPRQLPPEYSLVIQQFHRNWNEDEWLIELQQRYLSLFKITRMRVKDGTPLNAVRADFKSIDEVNTLLNSGKMKVGSMIHPVKRYNLPIRINKCLKCLRHDHTTKACTRARLCPRCAEEHSLEHGCVNPEKCINCGGDHISGHSACPVVQEKRRALMDLSKKHRAELLIRAEQQQYKYGIQGENPTSRNDKANYVPSDIPCQTTDRSQRTYAQTITNHQEQGPLKNIEYTLSSFLDKMERRLNEFSARLSSQLCEIEKKIDENVGRHRDLEKVVNDEIIPAIQELGNILTQSSKNKSIQDALKKFNEKINDMVSNQRPHRTTVDSQALVNNRLHASANACHH